MGQFDQLAHSLTDDLIPWVADRLGTGLRARVYNSANINIANNTLTDLTFNSEYWDDGGFHDTGANTARLTMPRAGTYLFIGHVEFAVAAGGRRQVLLVVNGATTIAVVEEDYVPAGGVNLNLTISTIYQLAAGDFVTLRVYQNSGGPLNVNAQANWSPDFMVVKIA